MLILRAQTENYIYLWTMDFGKVDRISHSAIIVTVPGLGA